MSRIRVLVVDDDLMAAAGITAILSTTDDIDVVGSRVDGDQVEAAVRELRPDVVLCDVRMPRMSGVAVASALAASVGGPAVLMMTAFNEDGLVLKAIEAGAAGFLTKDEDPRRIIEAVRTVAFGESAYSPRAARQLTEWVRSSNPAGSRREAADRLAQLTERERELALAVVDGATDAEIAARFFISATTVKSTLSAIRTKWGVRSRVELAVTVVRAGIA